MIDPVGAQVGQDVVVCMGLPARWAAGDVRYPVEASIAAIVDSVELGEGLGEGDRGRGRIRDRENVCAV